MTTAVWEDRASGWTARAGAASLIGNYRENNEDFVHLDPHHPFALVLDGMGGLTAGEIASRQGAEAVANALRQGLTNGDEPPGLISRAFLVGNESIMGLGRLDSTLRNIGTTIVLALMHHDRVHVSWLGDSRAYRVSGGRIKKLTWDHDIRTVLIHNGRFTPEEAEHARIRNVLWRYLGAGETKEPFDIPSFAPRHGDRLILATDGVTSVVPEPDLLRLCQTHPAPLVCAEELVNLALDCGSRDNCTCAVIAFERFDPAPAPPSPPQPPRKWWHFWK